MYQFKVTNAKDGMCLPGPCPIGLKKTQWFSYGEKFLGSLFTSVTL